MVVGWEMTIRKREIKVGLWLLVEYNKVIEFRILMQQRW
jgi:hypothetical protein